MFFLNGYTGKKIAAIFIFIVLPLKLLAQENILEKHFTFRQQNIKTDNALDVISKQSGFNFTYDSRLIDPESRIDLTFRDIPLKEILKSVFRNDSLVFSVIDKYIIISRPEAKSIVKEADPSSIPDAITGVIRDEETGEPLGFATVSLKKTPRGTVANGNGEFRFNISPEYYDDTLSVSYLGYLGREIPVSNAFGNDFTITMKREYVSIPEIIIRNQIPQEIIQKTRKAIPGNYGSSPALMTGFYREGILRKNDLQTYSEAVLRIYKSSYTGSLSGDQIKIFRSRKLENLERTDTLAVRLKAGLSTSLELDGARNLFDFIAPGSMEDYNYRLTDIVRYDDESAYVIEFSPKEYAELPLFSGTIYINTSDFGIFKAEFGIPDSRIGRIRDAFINASAGGFTTRLESVRYSVSYRKVQGRYFLSHVRGDLEFTSRQKRKLFKTSFSVFFEMAVTDAELDGVKRFDREEVAPIHSVFSKTINGYDRDFWGSQEFLRPEENLLQALEKMKVRLQEFNE